MTSFVDEQQVTVDTQVVNLPVLLNLFKLNHILKIYSIFNWDLLVYTHDHGHDIVIIIVEVHFFCLIILLTCSKVLIFICTLLHIRYTNDRFGNFRLPCPTQKTSVYLVDILFKKINTCIHKRHIL